MESKYKRTYGDVDLSVEELSGLDGIGEKTASKICNTYTRDELVEMANQSESWEEFDDEMECLEGIPTFGRERLFYHFVTRPTTEGMEKVEKAVREVLEDHQKRSGSLDPSECAREVRLYLRGQHEISLNYYSYV